MAIKKNEKDEALLKEFNDEVNGYANSGKKVALAAEDSDRGP